MDGNVSVFSEYINPVVWNLYGICAMGQCIFWCDSFPMWC